MMNATTQAITKAFSFFQQEQMKINEKIFDFDEMQRVWLDIPLSGVTGSCCARVL